MPERVFSGAPWERKAGYCRALRQGRNVAVAGTTSVDEDGSVMGVGNPYAQMKQCLAIVERALAECGARLADVTRTRMFVTRIDDWEAVCKAHAEAFGECPPVTTLVEVSRLIHPDMLVELEADAILPKEIS